MDEETEERPPFRWNPQAVFMLFFFMLLMAVPVMGVVWFGRGYLAAQRAAVAPKPAAAAKVVDTTALQEGLEKMSDVQFAPVVTVAPKDRVILAVAEGDMTGRIARILEIAQNAGGIGLEMSAAGENSRRVTIRVSATRLDLLKRAIRGEKIDFSAIPAGAETELLEVDLHKP